MDSPRPEHEPDPHDYSFLSDNINFSIKRHMDLLVKLSKAMENSDILKYDVFTIDTAKYLTRVLRRSLDIPAYKSIILERSLFPRFAGIPVGAGSIFDIAMLLAGNKNILDRNQIIVPNYRMEHPAWVPMTIKNMEEDSEKPSQRVTFSPTAV